MAKNAGLCEQKRKYTVEWGIYTGKNVPETIPVVSFNLKQSEANKSFNVIKVNKKRENKRKDEK